MLIIERSLCLCIWDIPYCDKFHIFDLLFLYLTEFPTNKGIPGRVLHHPEIVNVKDAYANAFFARETDQKSGFTTKTILAAPVMQCDRCVV